MRVASLSCKFREAVHGHMGFSRQARETCDLRAPTTRYDVRPLRGPESVSDSDALSVARGLRAPSSTNVNIKIAMCNLRQDCDAP